MDNVYFKSASGSRVGWIIGNDVKDNSGNRVGFINGNNIMSSGGTRIGFLNGSDFKDASGNRVGCIIGSDIKDTNGNRVGYPESSASSIEMCAAALLLFGLDYDGNDTSEGETPRYYPRRSGGGGGSGEDSGCLSVVLALTIFAFWHFLKGPFVAFSLIKEPSARKEWWGVCVRSVLLGLLFTMIIGGIAGQIGDIAIAIAVIFCLAFMVLPIVAVSIRRMHDIGKAGWWILVPFASFFMCGFLRGKVEGNKYI